MSYTDWTEGDERQGGRVDKENTCTIHGSMNGFILLSFYFSSESSRRDHIVRYREGLSKWYNKQPAKHQRKAGPSGERKEKRPPLAIPISL